MKHFLLFLLLVFSSENVPKYVVNPILVKIEEDEYAKMKTRSIGVTYDKHSSKWKVQRWKRSEKRNVFNGCYDDVEAAAHASDNLARKLMENGEQKMKLNFPANATDYWEEKRSKYIGVTYQERKWRAQRWSKYENKNAYNGLYYNEKTAAYASDTLARKLMENGEKKLKLNFPDDHMEVHREEKSSAYIGVSFDKTNSKWRVQRKNKNKNRLISNGYYDDEVTAAHASDTLARKLMENGEQKLKLNFPGDCMKVSPEKNQKKRKRQNDKSLKHPQNN